MRKELNYFLQLLVLLVLSAANNVVAYEDKITHPALTKNATENAKLDLHLKNQLGLSDGVSTIFPLYDPTMKVLALLQRGSTAEDDPMCRASNHFHDPLKAWNSSQVTDMPSLLVGACYAFHFIPRYSNITWATGYLSPPPNGEKTTFPLTWAPNNWDKARTYFENALTSKASNDREIYYAKTFVAARPGHAPLAGYGSARTCQGRDTCVK